MIVPSVMFIEMAQDALTKRDSSFLKKESSEFHSLGDQRRADIMNSVPENDEMMAGYLLGLETARALLATSPLMFKAGLREII